MEFKDILKKLRIEYGLTQEELSKKLGITRSSIANYENGLNYPNQEILIKITKFFNASSDYLIGLTPYKNITEEHKNLNYIITLLSKISDFEKDLLENEITRLSVLCKNENEIDSFLKLDIISNLNKNETYDLIHSLYRHFTTYRSLYKDKFKIDKFSEIVLFMSYENTNISNAFPVPDSPTKVVVLGRISAGLPILATENIEGYEYAPSSLIKEGYEYFYLRVQGDSMNLKFNDGDLVLVQQQDTLENDEIGVILVEDDATVKKYKNENGLIILEPMSNNPNNTVQVYDPKKIDIKIVGKVVSYQGRI